MAFYTANDVNLADLERLVGSSSTDLCDYPIATNVSSGVLLYDRGALLAADAGAVRAELASALLHGPGVLIIRGAFDRNLTLKVSDAFDALLDAQSRAPGGKAGDHFARAGDNSRVWNTLEKLARGWPELFVSYYANEPLALACEAWLGPNYQTTAQLNVMRPGALAQVPHRCGHRYPLCKVASPPPQTPRPSSCLQGLPPRVLHEALGARLPGPRAHGRLAATDPAVSHCSLGHGARLWTHLLPAPLPKVRPGLPGAAPRRVCGFF